ncbi:MAG TPA: hypothetical protein VFB63_09005 [Bryobacteraceae bacterium]|nr:hypothetical protein [Bryobacteraceae bacterium]
MRTILLFLIAAASVVADDKDRKERGPRQEATFTLRLIEAGSAAQGANDAAALVPAELKSLLRYTRYGLLDSGFVRGIDGKQLQLNLAGNMLCQVEFRMSGAGAAAMIEVDVELRHEKGVLLETRTRVKNGETTVLGASKMRGGSQALILLLTANLMR